MKILYMVKGITTTEIKINDKTKEVSFTNFDDRFMLCAFGKAKPGTITYKDVLDLLESRCVPKTRDGIKDYLNALNLTEYNPLEIVKKVKGRDAGDDISIEIIEDDGTTYPECDLQIPVIKGNCFKTTITVDKRLKDIEERLDAISEEEYLRNERFWDRQDDMDMKYHDYGDDILWAEYDEKTARKEPCTEKLWEDYLKRKEEKEKVEYGLENENE